MKASIRYIVHCSHTAFKHAISLHMKDAKFHEIGWRDTDRMDEDSDPYSSFSWPNIRYPELTKDLFFLMALAALQYDGKMAEFYVNVEVKTEDGESALSISDAWLPGYGNEHPAELYYRQGIFSKDMAERLAKIAALATDRGDI